MSSAWTELKSIRFRFFPAPVKISDDEFVLVPSKFQPYDVAEGIYAFNTKRNDWNKIMNYPKDCKPCSHSVLYDKDKRSIYIFNNDGKLLQFNLNEQKMEVVYQAINFGKYPGFILSNDKFHIFSCYDHGVYDRINKSFTASSKWPLYKSALFLKSKNVILIFSEIAPRRTSKVYLYSISKQQWTEKYVKRTHQGSTFVVASDDKYVISFGGYETPDGYGNVEATRNISVYDVDNNKIYFSKIICPDLMKVDAKAVIMTGNVLTLGYIRNGFDQSLPLDITKIIVQFVNEEYVHLIENKGSHHWRIRVDQILAT